MTSTNSSSSSSDLSILLKTANYAAIKHSTQRRKDPEKTPYINHPIGVANILSEEGGITELSILQAALLHDVIEDCDTTKEEIESLFGSTVASIASVDQVSDDKLLSKEERKLCQIQRAPEASISAKCVKMGDKIYNLRDLERVLPLGWSDEKRLEYFIWAQQVVIHCDHVNDKLADILKELFKRNIPNI